MMCRGTLLLDHTWACGDLFFLPREEEKEEVPQSGHKRHGSHTGQRRQSKRGGGFQQPLPRGGGGLIPFGPRVSQMESWRALKMHQNAQPSLKMLLLKIIHEPSM